jgi:hypothetical protein
MNARERIEELKDTEYRWRDMRQTDRHDRIVFEIDVETNGG